MEKLSAKKNKDGKEATSMKAKLEGTDKKGFDCTAMQPKCHFGKCEEYVFGEKDEAKTAKRDNDEKKQKYDIYTVTKAKGCIDSIQVGNDKIEIDKEHDGGRGKMRLEMGGEEVEMMDEDLPYGVMPD